MIQNSVRLIRLKDVAQLCGLPKTTIMSLAKRDGFPKAVRLGARSTTWVESEVAAWLNNAAGRTILSIGDTHAQPPSVTTQKAKPEVKTEVKAEEKTETVSMKEHPLRIIRAKEVKVLTGLGAAALYYLEKSGGFPKKVRLGSRSVGWRLGEVLNWIQAR